jgi:hypothetical protein
LKVIAWGQNSPLKQNKKQKGTINMNKTQQKNERVTEVFEAFAPLKDTQVIEEMAVGHHVRQGDIYVEMIEKISLSAKPTDNMQLAPGESKGSRHTVFGCKVYEIKHSPNRENPILLGPQISSKERFTVSHPEHADFSMPPGNYQVIYQMDYATKRRIQD